jgi:hypothetical protein
MIHKPLSLDVQHPDLPNFGSTCTQKIALMWILIIAIGNATREAAFSVGQTWQV